ncbi:D-2-hydroxyacid dehydrogenase [Periweissella cryptocerci]|uniref:D-2-hydroxyacid dehydrogenase n=1 Tax=Periweissella cryptocerci TaxID=2506420 RepID=A0A4P6YU38_9LACO|nr:D-2-hydroxyacid dehydrogenase [Periweissella cryptocerci]QBO36213.1 D-2-hydroxyacid dehydrogenase [Periweissella cryptocerci]
MTKILMYSVRDDEQVAIANFAQTHGVQIDSTTAELHGDTVELATGYDGVIIQQHAGINDDGVYTKLAQQGIKQVTSRTAGFDTINVPAAKAAGLTVTNVPAYSPRSVAEMALMQIFRLLRNTPAFDARVRRNDFRWEGLQAREIHSVTVGIIGLGRIGETLAKMLKALDVRVIANDLVERAEMRDVVEYMSKEAVLQQADVISLHVYLDEQSTGLLAKDEFDLMKKGALIVNASRGPVINTADLIEALDAGIIAGAALDTVEGEEHIFNEDLSASGVTDERIKKLLTLENVIITPHVGFFTNIAVQNMVDISLTDVLSIITTGTSAHDL